MNLSEGWRQLKELKENTYRNQNYFIDLMENLFRTLLESLSIISNLFDTLLKESSYRKRGRDWPILGQAFTLWPRGLRDILTESPPKTSGNGGEKAEVLSPEEGVQMLDHTVKTKGVSYTSHGSDCYLPRKSLVYFSSVEKRH